MLLKVTDVAERLSLAECQKMGLDMRLPPAGIKEAGSPTL